MNVEYLVGSKDDFLRFLDSIGLYDKVAVLTHNDLDGVASGIFIEKILEAKGIKLDYINFLDIKIDMVKEISINLKERGITKVFFSDLNVESIDPEGYEDLRREKDVFLIDHHPIPENLKDKSNMIKTISEDCAALDVFVLGEEILDYPSWGWLVSAAIFADYSFRLEKNFNFLKSFYPEATFENLSSSVPGLNARKISSALVYYKNDVTHVYNLLKERNLEELSEIHELIEEEVYKIVDDFSIHKEYFPERDIYFYEIKSRFDVLSYVATLIAGADMEKNFLFMYRGKEMIKFSARSSKSKINMGELMKKGVEGFPGADGGGHSEAAAAKIMPENLEAFKKRVLE
ncbi:MAG: DHHA1 domain-containing protein [archaeon]|nr:DHHA1 domain-containing protein [archaeon]